MNNVAGQAISAGSKITAKAEERYWRATLARDARADGTFILGVLSTRIYCRPSCPARRPLRQNVVFFGSGEEAEKQGFRPCLRCKPNEKPGALRLVERAARELAGGEEDILRVATLAGKLGVTPSALRRAFQQLTGLAPRDLADAVRVYRFKRLVRGGQN